MMRQDVFCGDIYSGDMTIDAVNRAGFSFESGRSYLEFGCSSAPLLRTMYATCPTAHWFGCDPVSASIEWARARFPFLNLSCSPQRPKLDHHDQFFAGAYAISIWSHFSERAAVAWFEELHRVIEPNGFLMFTTHGYRSLYYYLTQGMRDEKTVGKLFAEMIQRQYAFHPIFSLLNIEDSGLALEDWGDCYLTCDWILSKLANSWTLAGYQCGRNQSNQDVYVLRRK
jgi:SAM-dependent methyltransferase